MAYPLLIAIAWLLLALPALSHLGRADRALACTPPPGGLPDYSVADRAADAPVILEGTITHLGDDFPQVATIAVNRYFKGIGPAEVTISGFGPSSVCLSEVNEGDHLVFYAQGSPDTGLQANYLSQFDAVDPADVDTVNELIEAVGREPVAPRDEEATAGSSAPPGSGNAPLPVPLTPPPDQPGVGQTGSEPTQGAGPRFGLVQLSLLATLCLCLLVAVGAAGAAIWLNRRSRPTTP
jgi:hypothetical protein